MALSKDFQLQDAIGHIKNLLNDIAGDALTKDQIIDAIHAGISETAQLLSELKKYDYCGAPSTLTITSNVASIASLNVMDIIKIVDATNGYCRYLSPVQFEGVYDVIQNRQVVHWTRNGENILFNKGSLSAYGVVKMYYNRYPTKATADSDYLDLKDPYMDVALSKAKLHLYEQLDIIPPKALEQSVNNTIIQWRKNYADSLAKRKMNKGRRR